MKKILNMYFIELPYCFFLVLYSCFISNVIDTSLNKIETFIIISVVLNIIYFLGSNILYLLLTYIGNNYIKNNNKIILNDKLFISRFIIGDILMWIFIFGSLGIGFYLEMILFLVYNIFVIMIIRIVKNHRREMIFIGWLVLSITIFYFSISNFSINKNELSNSELLLKNEKVESNWVDYNFKAKADLSEYLNLPNFQEKYRQWYWKIRYNEAPIRGSLHLSRNKNRPLVVIVHGNHSMAVESELGYKYLAEAIFEKDYNVALVDENYLNASWHHGISGEMDARAYLTNLHIQNLIANYDFNIDENKVILIGHSRGGEAISLMAYKKQSQEYRIKKDYKIETIIAIAPTFGQYQPRDKNWKIIDINYMLIQGTMDQDVYAYLGRNMLNKIALQSKNKHMMSVLIEGANHSQFNSLWGKYDRSDLLAYSLNFENMLSGKTQKKILINKINEFLEIINNNQNAIKINKKQSLCVYANSNMHLITSFEAEEGLGIIDQKNRRNVILNNKIWDLSSSNYTIKNLNNNSNLQIYLDVGFLSDVKNPELCLEFKKSNKRIGNMKMNLDNYKKIKTSNLSKYPVIEKKKFGELEEIYFQTIRIPKNDFLWDEVIIKSTSNVYIDNVYTEVLK